jgi:hypothetical protein
MRRLRPTMALLDGCCGRAPDHRTPPDPVPASDSPRGEDRREVVPPRPSALDRTIAAMFATMRRDRLADANDDNRDEVTP